MTATIKKKAFPSVGMGQLLVAQGPDQLIAILGSCIGVALFHPRSKIAALAHVVLPHSHGREGLPAKFADTAIPEMLAQMREAGAGRHGIVARITGGSSMFKTSGPLQIGVQNLEAVEAALKLAGVPLSAKEVGGTKGRRVTLNCDTGTLTIETVGQEPRTI
jgi:chemotaxis protein CheD